MTYLGELRANIRVLLAAGIGIGTGLGFFGYMNAIFAPFLLEQFGWPRSQFALVGFMTFTTLLVLPVIGRFVDILGVRRIALLGTITIPCCLVGYSLQNGSFYFYLAVYTVMLGCASLTSPLVYTRLIATRFDKAQGLALTIVTSAPSVVGAIVARPLTAFVQAYGWRVGYLTIAVCFVILNVIALSLIPRALDTSRDGRTAARKAHSEGRHYDKILRSSTFWIMLVAILLCLVPTPVQTSQMNLMLLDQGMSKNTAATVITVFAIGTIVGRVFCGLALDRFSSRVVSALSMGLPGFGFLLLALPYNAPGVIAVAMFTIGFSFGAESDLMSFLVARYFGLEIFSTTLGLIGCGAFLGAAIGAVMISATLHHANTFVPFLYIAAGVVFVGSLVFLLLPRNGLAAEERAPPEAAADLPIA